MQKKPRLRLGMVGGGKGAFIGAVHRIAARLDDEYELVAGAFSSTPDIARDSGAALGIAPDRVYASFEEMARAELARPDGIEVVSIVTPNHMHVAPAKAFLEAGIHVICEKPLASRLEDARELAKVKPRNGARFLLTHNYTGYPLIRLARQMVADDALGRIRVVQAEYPQDWLTVEAGTDNKQASWRTDPERSGIGGAIGDIGTHAYNLARYVTGLRVEAVAADLVAFVPGRRVDDNVHVLMRLENGVRGMLWASQVAPGNENALRLRVYGEKGGLEWSQENPNEMWFNRFGQPRQLLTRGGAISGEAPETMNVRIPAGHPEGYLEAFATLYAQFAAVVRGEGEAYAGLLPDLEDGVEGLKFIVAAHTSNENDGAWTRIEDV